MINIKNSVALDKKIKFYKKHFEPMLVLKCIGYKCKSCNESIDANSAAMDQHLAICKGKK